ncbi:MAG: hypothetical protein K6G71_00100 [Clostridiales bacterium]|nr:hypothetical protein [Clostridiales bacterium]
MYERTAARELELAFEVLCGTLTDAVCDLAEDCTAELADCARLRLLAQSFAILSGAVDSAADGETDAGRPAVKKEKGKRTKTEEKI